MKIKRFFAADIRQAMRMVKEELGADAVIMSNRSVDGGVEIVAARDFDEQVIQSNLKQQREEERTASRLKRLDIPELAADEKPAHLITSNRKRSNEPENPIRRNIDQYIGYAEKVQLANVNAQKIADKIKTIEKPAWAVASEPKPTPVVAPVKVSAPHAPEKFMDEMRKEIRDLRSMLDSKLSNIPHLPHAEEQPVRRELLERLDDCGFSRVLANKIANRLGSHKQFDTAWAKSQEMLAKIVPIADDRLLEQGGIAALVGSTGVGKTTTVAKLAAQFMLKHGNRQIALITTDNYRIGAHEQINTYGKILDIPVRVAADANELRRHIDSFSDKRLILIDTAGMSQRDMRLAEQFQTLYSQSLPIRTYLVMSATTQHRAALEIMDAFQMMTPQATILTKFDEAVSKATALSALIERRMPLSFVTDGQQVPEDICIPDAVSLIQQCTQIDAEHSYADNANYDSWLADSHA
jgi:flagellar biosynthesis protein FlhF